MRIHCGERGERARAAPPPARARAPTVTGPMDGAAAARRARKGRQEDTHSSSSTTTTVPSTGSAARSLCIKSSRNRPGSTRGMRSSTLGVRSRAGQRSQRVCPHSFTRASLPHGPADGAAHLFPEAVACCCSSVRRCRRQAASAGSSSPPLSSKSDPEQLDPSSPVSLSSTTARRASAVALKEALGPLEGTPPERCWISCRMRRASSSRCVGSARSGQGQVLGLVAAKMPQRARITCQTLLDALSDAAVLQDRLCAPGLGPMRRSGLVDERLLARWDLSRPGNGGGDVRRGCGRHLAHAAATARPAAPAGNNEAHYAWPGLRPPTPPQARVHGLQAVLLLFVDLFEATRASAAYRPGVVVVIVEEDTLPQVLVLQGRHSAGERGARGARTVANSQASSSEAWGLGVGRGPYASALTEL